MSERNVLGGPLQPCSSEPLTGFYRDGCCSTGPEDLGLHTICAVVTAEFLEHQRVIGNDLSTPMPQYRFPAWCPATGGVSPRATGCWHTGTASPPPVVLATRTSAPSTSCRWALCGSTPSTCPTTSAVCSGPAWPPVRRPILTDPGSIRKSGTTHR